MADVSDVADINSQGGLVPKSSPSEMVGTLTFHEAINYGAALQAFALQNAIRKLGHDSEVINYSCEAIRKAYMMPSSLKRRIGWILRSCARSRRLRKFDSFYNAHVRVSAPVSRSEFNDAADKYRSIVVGSDQVWNPLLTNGDLSYFLDCVDDSSKKKSYAASLGVRAWPLSEECKYIEELNRFSSLTVREKSAAEYLGRLLGKCPPTVCDPTMLLTEEEWSSISAPLLVDDPYVLMYCFGNPEPDCLSWAKKQAKKMNCRLVVIHLAAFPLRGVINMRGCGPTEFLSLIKHARLVVTHSFHGICFSIIFNRDFCWFNSSSASDGLKGRSSRIEDMLERFGLSDRAVNSQSSLPAKINYDSVNREVSLVRESSLDILRDML